MKQLIISIYEGYIAFLKNTAVFAGILLFFLVLAILAGYPLWYLATEYPTLYTSLGLFFLLGAFVLYTLGRLKAIYAQKGRNGIKNLFQGMLLLVSKSVYLFLSLSSIIYFASRRQTLISLLFITLFIVLSGVFFLRKKNS